MTREIKFRAWNSDAHMMIVPSAEELGGLMNHPDLNSEFTLMQYTGLHDKNGHEIYEGDVIVRVATQRGTGKRLELDRQVVEIGPFYFADYEDGCAGSGFMIPSCSLEDIPNQWEVIGNIYESPELIEKS